jgi:hypothetical protein
MVDIDESEATNATDNTFFEGASTARSTVGVAELPGNIDIEVAELPGNIDIEVAELPENVDIEGGAIATTV